MSERSSESELERLLHANDRQLENIRALAEYSLWCSADRSVAQILERTQRLVGASFAVDYIFAALVHTSGQTLDLDLHAEGPAEIPREMLPDRLEPRIHQPEELDALCRQLGIESKTPIAVIPMWADDERVAAVVIAMRASMRSSGFRPVLDDSALPFLQLVATHASRALERAMLTASLRQQSQRLAEANAQLTQSLEQLAQAQKMEAIGRLAGGIAHDFNNLLTIIVSHAELLGDALPTNGAAREDLDQIISASRHAGAITRQLLTFSRHKTRDGRTLDLNEVTRSMARMLRPMLGERYALDLDLDPTLPWLRIDSAEVQQVLLNLVLNARDAMIGGGRVALHTRMASSAEAEFAGAPPGGRYAILSVRDEGIGIDAETRAKIFDPFFTTKPPGQGTGLGLSTTYGIVTNAGGYIVVDSRVGRGSTFSVLLPIVDRLTPAEGVPMPVATRGTVLVVEDEDAIRQVLCRVLRSHGYTVVDSRSAEEALAVVERCPSVDLLVTDVVMPGMSGVELAGKLREDRSNLPVLYVSGYTFDRLDSEDLPSRRERFLAKPFTPRQLMAEVERSRTGHA